MKEISSVLYYKEDEFQTF